MFLILALIILVSLSYIYLNRTYSYWKRKGVPQTNPVYLFGDNWANLIRKVSIVQLFQGFYSQAGDNRYFGFYQLLTPALLVKDPALLKQITVKDFDHFQDHFQVVPEDIDALWSRNLLSLTGERWKEMRATLSPSFTSSKMRVIFQLISECSETFNDYFASLKEDQLKNIEMKDVFTRFANDVIASVAFGVRCDSLKNRDNEFYRMGKEATDFSSPAKAYKLFILFLSSKLAKLLGIKIFTSVVASFFRNVVKNTIEYRQREGVTRPDMLQLLMEASKTDQNHEEENGHIIDEGFARVEESDIGKNTKHVKYQLTNEDITAQGLIFFFAGFDSVTSLMSFMSHQLALNPDIQERLREEVDDTKHYCEGKISYEALLKMKYMDMVVSECLRMWPVFISPNRLVTKSYVIQPSVPTEKPVYLKVGDLIVIPTQSIHMDPAHYADPEKFDPERFSDENKAKIKPYTYLPFGLGPRNCIGSRFALLEIKTVFFHLLSNFQICVCEKTEIPLTLNKVAFSMTAANGFWVSLKRRDIAA